MNHNFINLIGQKFFMLIVLRYFSSNKNGNALWLCRCDCGKETIVLGSNLRNGNTRSCGCLKNIGKNIRNIDGLYHRQCLDCHKVDKFMYSVSKYLRCRSCAEKHKYQYRRSNKLIIKTQSEINDIIELYKRNESLVIIGKKYNMSAKTILRILKENYSHYKPRTWSYNIEKMQDTIRKKCKTGEWQKMISAKAQGIPIEEWQNFVTKESEFFYHSDEWKKLRNEIFKRDNHTCMLCLERGGNLNAHHIKKRSEFKELSLDMDNIITLCVNCHDKTKFRENLYENIFKTIINEFYL